MLDTSNQTVLIMISSSLLPYCFENTINKHKLIQLFRSKVLREKDQTQEVRPNLRGDTRITERSDERLTCLSAASGAQKRAGHESSATAALQAPP